MSGWIPIQKITLKCPFCGEEGVTAQYIPPSLGSHTSRSSGGKNTQIFRVQERYEGISGCSRCGKSDKEVKRALKEGTSNPERDKKIIERLKEQGLLFNGEIKTKVK